MGYIPRMKTLSQFLADEKITKTQAAIDLGVSRPHIVNLCAGRRYPSAKLMAKIEIYTRAQVPLVSFMNKPAGD